MKELFKKIQQVSNEINNIEKDMTVGSGSYSYKAVSDIQVTLAVKRAETKHGIASVPIKQEQVGSEVIRTIRKDGNEGLTYVDTIKLTLKIVDLESGESIEVESFGKGIDSGDKGFGKASTYARKYALLNAYKIPTGEDPDADKSVEQSTTATISEKRKLVTDYLDTDVKVKNEALSHFGVDDSSQLAEKDINTMYSTFKKRKVI